MKTRDIISGMREGKGRTNKIWMKCSRLFPPANSLIDQQCHCVVGIASIYTS